MLCSSTTHHQSRQHHTHHPRTPCATRVHTMRPDNECTDDAALSRVLHRKRTPRRHRHHPATNTNSPRLPGRLRFVTLAAVMAGRVSASASTRRKKQLGVEGFWPLLYDTPVHRCKSSTPLQGRVREGTHEAHVNKSALFWEERARPQGRCSQSSGQPLLPV